jgi:tetratricopeptide (TPR) repeat protein
VIRVHHLYRHIPDAVHADLQRLVRPYAWTTAREEEGRQLFGRGVKLLESSRPEEAINVFNLMVDLTRGSGYMALFKGIALEFGGHFDEALWLFDRFRYQPQAGPFIKHAWYHTMLIREIQSAQVDTSKLMRAMAYHKVSANYWDLGFHRHALETLQLAFRADSNFTPGLIFGMYYSIQLGDTSAAKRYFSRVQQADTNHIMNSPVRKIFALMDSVRIAKTPAQRIGYELSLAKGYASIGLRDLTIDQTLAILQVDPNNAGALELLAQSYDVKERRWPAIQILERLLVVKPESPIAREKLQELRSHL